jgi:hypothetical protein
VTDSVYNIVQFGYQSAVGTSVAATTLFPVDTGFLGFELDRASETPDEDFGRSSRNAAGRHSTGVRGAEASLPFVCRFEDIMQIFEMHLMGGETPTDANPVYTWVYTADQTASTLVPRTVEYGVDGSTQDEWEATGVICNELEIGFDALSSPGNSMWTGTAGLLAVNRAPAAITGSISAPGTLETMEGHLTTLAYGGTGTAFGSLSALTGSLKQFRLTSTINAVRRAYGGATDIASAYGRSGKAEATFEALIAISATSDTNMLDIFEVAGAVPTEQRWRIAVAGSGTKAMQLDFRTVFRSVNIGEHEGERLYLVNGETVYDATLASHLTATVVNGVSALPA